MVERLAAGVVGRVVVLATVGQIRPKIKQLKRTHEGGNHPKNDEVFHGKPQFQDVVGNGHHQHLDNGEILFGKSKKPQKEIGVAVVVVGVVECTRVAVVQVVVGVERFKIVEGKQSRC